MSLEILLHPSDATPAPSDYRATLVRALAERGADWDAEDGALRLADGGELHFFIEPGDDIALACIETVEARYVELIFDLAQATHSYVMSGGYAYRLPACGPAQASLAAGFPTVALAETPEALRTALEADLARQTQAEADEAEYQAAKAEALRAAREREGLRQGQRRPAHLNDPIVGGRPAFGLFQMLSDALFGKKV